MGIVIASGFTLINLITNIILLLSPRQAGKDAYVTRTVYHSPAVFYIIFCHH